MDIIKRAEESCINFALIIDKECKWCVGVLLNQFVQNLFSKGST